MPRDLQPDFALHVLNGTSTMATCWKITRADGVVMGFTSHTRKLVIDGVTYLASSGILPTAVESSSGTGVSNMDVFGIVRTDALSSDDLRQGRYNHAAVEIFLVDYSRNPVVVGAKQVAGTMGEVTLNGAKFQSEVRDLTQLFSVQIVDLVQATCRYEFGDDWCQATIRSNAGAVSGLVDARTFTSNGLIGSRPDDFFNGGRFTWNSGPNAGLDFMVKDYVQATGRVQLHQAMVLPIALGDTFTIREGCAKTLQACKTKQLGAVINNVINFGGEPDVPGPDFLLRVVRAS